MSDFADPLLPTPKQIQEKFVQDLEILGGQSALAQEMHRLGDKRSSTLRSIQRMASGDTRVSGEMQVIVELLLKARRRAEYETARLPWAEIQQGCWSVKDRHFTMTLSPQTRGRWLVHLMHENGFSPPWPNWQPSLEEAKIKAVLCLEDALDSLRTHELLEAKLSNTAA